MIIALQKYNDTPTMVSEGSATISSLDKPILITICKNGQFDYARAPLIGYSGSTSFITGKHNDTTILSWTGTGNMTINGALSYLFQSETEDGNVNSNFQDTATRFMVPYGLCTVAQGKLSKLLLQEPTKRFKIYLKNSGKYYIFITDLAAALHFHLQQPLTTGDSISVEVPANFTLRKRAAYTVELTERRVTTQDGTCTTYPDRAGHTSYQHCVEQENRRRILPALGCMVPWMSDDDQCKGVMKRLPAHEDTLKWIKRLYYHSWSGNYFAFSSCLLPCTLVFAHAEYLNNSEDESNGDHTITIYFKETVKVKTVILAYGMDSLLIEIGSSLGLWLGLSVVGLFDVLLIMVLKLKQLVGI